MTDAHNLIIGAAYFFEVVLVQFDSTLCKIIACVFNSAIKVSHENKAICDLILENPTYRAKLKNGVIHTTRKLERRRVHWYL